MYIEIKTADPRQLRSKIKQWAHQSNSTVELQWEPCKHILRVGFARETELIAWLLQGQADDLDCELGTDLEVWQQWQEQWPK